MIHSTVIHSFLLATLSFSNPEPVHDFYAAIVEIEHNDQSQSWQISLKFFADDLEAILVEQDPSYPGLAKEGESALQPLVDYIREHLRFSDSGRSIQYDFVGKELDQEALWCYVEIPEERFKPEPGTSLTLECDLMRNSIRNLG